MRQSALHRILDNIDRLDDTHYPRYYEITEGQQQYALAVRLLLNGPEKAPFNLEIQS
jgi:hypothetical protein